MAAVIHQINTSAGGVPKTAVAAATVTTGGLAGDACAKTNIHGGPDQALSLFSREVIDSLAAAGHPITPGSTGENITISGLDWSTLAPGMQVCLGDAVVLEITSYAAPCKTIAGSFSGGDVSLLNQRLHPGQSRLYTRVLQQGDIRVGDAVRVEPGDLPAADDATGDQAADGLELGYVNLYVSDLERSVDFFQNTLGLALQFADDSFGFASFNAGPVRFNLARVDTTDPQTAGLTGRHTGLGFTVNDLEAAHKRLASRGVGFPMLPSRQPWGGFMALFEDPDGNVFYLDQQQG